MELAFTTRLKPWGNSLGIMMSKRALRKIRAARGTRVKIVVTPEKRLLGKDVFGMAKNKTDKTIAESLREADEELDIAA